MNLMIKEKQNLKKKNKKKIQKIFKTKMTKQTIKKKNYKEILQIRMKIFFNKYKNQVRSTKKTLS